MKASFVSTFVPLRNTSNAVLVDCFIKDPWCYILVPENTYFDENVGHGDLDYKSIVMKKCCFVLPWFMKQIIAITMFIY